MDELIVKEKEIREKLVEIINTSGLPAFILKSIIKDILLQLETYEQQQYQQALEEINKKEKNKKKEVKND